MDLLIILRDALGSSVVGGLLTATEAKGLTAVAEAAGLTKDMPATPPPTWPTLLKVISGLGLKLTPVTVKSAA